MTKRGLIVLGGGVPLLALIALLAWASISTGGNPGGLVTNSDLLEFDIDPEAARGFEPKVVMVDFWASWCPPCRVEAPALARVYAEYRGQPVEFVGVDVWDNVGDAEVFLQQEGQVYPAGHDADGSIAINYGVRGIPEKYFIDGDGVLVKKLSGPLTEANLRETINELLAR